MVHMRTQAPTPISNTDRLGRRRRVSGGGTDFLSDREICARQGFSLMTLYRMRRKGQFPQAVQISPGRKATPVSVYDAHIESLCSILPHNDPEAA